MPVGPAWTSSPRETEPDWGYAMGDPSRGFFERLDEHGFDARLGQARGTLRFEVRDETETETWFVALDRGAIQASQEERPADCVVRLDRATLDGIVEGTTNPTAAFLRGVIWTTGNFDLLLLLQRLLPTGTGAPDRRSAAASGGHHE